MPLWHVTLSPQNRQRVYSFSDIHVFSDIVTQSCVLSTFGGAWLEKNGNNFVLPFLWI